MIKILILLAVTGLITYIGTFLSANKKKRMQVFAELYEFNEQLILTLKFSRSSMDKIASPFNFVPQILKTDALSQVDYLTERKTVLKKYKEESFADYKKYSSLYVKIFFLIGVLIAVLLA